MIIDFGNCQNGKSVEMVMLKAPWYVRWVLDQEKPYGKLLVVRNEMTRLMDVFDAKPILRKCTTPECERVVTRASGYKDNVAILRWWCDECDPFLGGALLNKVSLIRTYEDALDHIYRYCENRKTDY